MEFIEKFIDAMHAAGCGPQNAGDIKADDKRNYCVLEGDRPNKKRCAYQLKIEDGFAVGWFLNFKHGEVHKFHSSNGKKLNPEEKLALKKKYEAQRKARDKEIKTRQDKAANIANRRWKTTLKPGTTPYSERKSIKLTTARILNNNIYCAMTDGEKIVNLQKIMPDGTKRFIAGGLKKGCYTALAHKDDDKSTIVIVEGLATGESVREATGYPVIVAYDAGNLEPVAKKIRKKYPDARIIIAADNDQFTKKQNGTLWNVGIEKGRAAAKACDGFIIWPEFNSDEDKLTDFNDLHCKEGLEVVNSRLGEVGEKVAVFSVSDNSLDSLPDLPPPPPIEIYEREFGGVRDMASDDDWKELLLTNKEGKLKASSLHNIILMLQFNPTFKGMFKLDAFAQQIVMSRCPPWIKHQNFKVDNIDDVVITRAASELEMFGLSPNTSNVMKAIEAVAQDNEFHPAREYFDNLEWDGTERLKGWLTYYLGCEDENPEYLSFIGKKWLTAAVKRVYEPGCKFDHILVLEGEQGRGKSMFLEELCTFGEDHPRAYFTDGVSIKDIGDKDTIMKVQGSIICELAELDGFSKKDDDEIKRWITMKHDDCRLPYARTIKRFPRQFVLAATTNGGVDGYSYLKDPTGNRRYWPCRVKSIDVDALVQDRQQLWAEAVHWYKEKLYIGPTPAEMRMAEIEQKKRLHSDVWTDDVLDAIQDIIYHDPYNAPVIKVATILEKMGIMARDRNAKSNSRVASILRQHGYVNKAQYNQKTGKTERSWIKSEPEYTEEEVR
ncbi:MAG: VapE domain-containing protein [Candidatus Anammoxibacter sp.]